MYKCISRKPPENPRKWPILGPFSHYLRSESQYFTPKKGRFSGVCARSARGSRGRPKWPNLQEYTGFSPGRPRDPGSGPDTFLELVHTEIRAQFFNILGPKNPLFLGGNLAYFTSKIGVKSSRIYGFPEGLVTKKLTKSRT